MSKLTFEPVAETPAMSAERARVRAFLAERWLPCRERFESDGFSPEFSRMCGEAGFIGMTFPKEHGGHGRSFLERYVVTEEMLSAGAPIRAHWVADRQSGALIARYAAPHVRADILPRIVSGECYFCIGLSEANSGSDLFSVQARADRVEGGWLVNGTKLWTSHAHRVHYMIALLRTSKPSDDNRRHGLTQFLIPTTARGITVRPVINLAGVHDFNEVHFDNAFVADDHVLGEVDGAWKQASEELAYERSGPDRFLETFQVLRELVRFAATSPRSQLEHEVGVLVAELYALRQMSLSVAQMLERGRTPAVEAALVKDVGTLWQQALPERARGIASLDERYCDDVELRRVIDRTLLIAPKLTIQGGTTEVLRGIIAGGLGLR